ncbi:MAG TPA: AtpZ/AtpI family protein [Candidatus Acidoferrum sp.]
MDSDTEKRGGESEAVEKARKVGTNSALAMELPFTIVGAVLLGGLLGFFLDRWIHTKPVFMLILGGLGFAGGVREVVRRLK